MTPHRRLSYTCLWVSECLLQRHGSAVTCCGDKDSGGSRGMAFGISHLGRGRHWPTIEPLSRWHTNCRTIIAKKFLHCCKDSRAHNRFPNLDIWQKDWEPPGKQQNLLCTKTQEKGEMTPQETELDLPVIVLESLVEAWVDRGLPWGQGYWLPQSWKLQYVGINKSFWRPNYREGTQPYP